MPKTDRITPPARRTHILLTVLRWLALSLVGWLVYALARALGAVIALGMPFFDWQWYLALIVSLIASTVWVIWRRPRSKYGAWVFAGLLFWLVAGYSGLGQELEFYPAHKPPIPISFWTGLQINRTPETVLQDLRATGGRLYLSIGEREFAGENTPALLDGLRRLAGHDIEVYLVVRASDYLSVPVHDEWMDNVQKTVALVQQENLSNVQGIVGDAEHPKRTLPDIWGTDRETFFQAVAGLDNLIRWMREAHPDLNLGVTAEWPLYLDHLDGDSDLSIIYRSPVDPPGNWGWLNAMTYSSFVPPPWQAYYVYLVEQAMAQLYPDHSPSHLIGLAARGNPGEPLLGFDALVRDARLSRAMGVSEIVVYKLDGALKIHGDDFVQRLAAAVNDVPADMTVRVHFSRPASALIYTTLVVDALLDVRSLIVVLADWLPGSVVWMKSTSRWVRLSIMSWVGI